VYYDDSEDDTEDFQWHPKKFVKKMKGTKVSVIMCCCCGYYILYYIHLLVCWIWYEYL